MAQVAHKRFDNPQKTSSTYNVDFLRSNGYFTERENVLRASKT